MTGSTSDVTKALTAGIELASAAVDSGAAERVLARWIEVARPLSSES